MRCYTLTASLSQVVVGAANAGKSTLLNAISSTLEDDPYEQAQHFALLRVYNGSRLVLVGWNDLTAVYCFEFHKQQPLD